MPLRSYLTPVRPQSYTSPCIEHTFVLYYARRTHWFLDEDGVDRWGSRIFVKINAPAIVRHELGRPAWHREYVAVGTVTDPYQPLEGRYRLTRRILEAFGDYDTPAGIRRAKGIASRREDRAKSACFSFPLRQQDRAQRRGRRNHA